MAASGTYAFSPSLADLFIQAFGRCQIRRAAIEPEHLRDAAMCANLMQVDWSNEHGVNLWTVDLVSTALVDGTASYSVDASAIAILAAYVQEDSVDTIIGSISRDDYAAIPDKTKEGKPSQYWFNRQSTSPVVLLWPVPDASSTYTLKYYRARQMQDATATSGLNADVPYRFLEAYTAGLASKIAELYAPKELPRLMVSAKIAFDKAARRDVENAPITFAPSLSGYFR